MIQYNVKTQSVKWFSTKKRLHSRAPRHPPIHTLATRLFFFFSSFLQVNSPSTRLIDLFEPSVSSTPRQPPPPPPPSRPTQHAVEPRLQDATVDQIRASSRALDLAVCRVILVCSPTVAHALEVESCLRAHRVFSAVRPCVRYCSETPEK